jgi:hypothetical protein
MNIGFNYELRKAYVDLIGTLTYNSQQLKAYDSFATDDAALPYVLIDSITSSDSRNKCDSVEDAAVTVIIESSYNQGGRKTVDEIASLIMTIKGSLRNQVATITTAFALMDVYKITDNTISVQSGTAKNYRRVITFGHILSQ